MRKQAFFYFLLVLIVYMLLKLLISSDTKYFFVINEIENVSNLNIKMNQSGSLFQLEHIPKYENMIYRLNLSKKKSAWMAIGLSTVKRPTKSYLIDTINSLLKSLSADERKDVLIVVFIAEVSYKY